MLAMARALISDPKVLLLDEPSLGLAPQVTSELMNLILELCHANDLTVVLVEQNAKSALRISHDAVVLHLGSGCQRRRGHDRERQEPSSLLPSAWCSDESVPFVSDNAQYFRGTSPGRHLFTR